MQQLNKPQSGIGLLELLLVFTIIGALLFGVMRYYQIAQNSQKIRVSLNAVQAAYDAAAAYFHTTGSAPNSAAALISYGYLPDNFAITENPWGSTELSITNQSTSRINMVIPDLNRNNCLNLLAKLNQLPIVATTSDCLASDTTINITFKDFTAHD